MKKVRKIVALLLCFVMGMSLVACSTTSEKSDPSTTTAGSPSKGADAESNKPITIQFWNGWTGSDGDVLTELVDEFNKTNKWGITVEMDISPSFADQFATAMAANEGPTMILSNAASKFSYESQIVAMDDIWDKTELKKEDFMDTYLSALTTDDGLFGLPFQISSYVVYWNKDLFKAAGLDPEAPPASYDQWTEYAKKITNADKHIYGSGLSYSNVGADACLMQMFGGLMVTQKEDGTWQANITNNEGYKKYIDWFKTQFENGSNPTEADLDTMFIAGQLGMYVTGPWLMANLKESNVNYGLTTLIETPEGGKQAPSNTQCFMITTTATEEEKLAAYRFLEWWHKGNDGDDITKTAVYAWSDKIGYPTYYKPVMESEGYKNNKQIYAITVTDPEYIADSCSPGNFRGWSSLLTDCLVNLFNAVVYDDDADKLLEDAQKTAEQIIAKEYGTGK